MSLVVFENVDVQLGTKTICSDVGLRIDREDRLGVVGPNGSGKTTVLRLIAGDLGPDRGSLHRQKNTRIGYLAQHMDVAGGRTLMEFVRDSVPGRDTLEGDIATVEQELGRTEDEDTLMALSARLADLHGRLARFEQDFGEHQAGRIVDGLRFSAEDQRRDVGEFSGGWRMRAVLAGLLFQRPDLLLLDEPTNHLDMPSVGWFSGFLRRYPAAIVLISHDREFLDEQIDRVVSFETEGVRQYSGNYTHYRKQRAEEEVLLENRARNLAREREKAEQFIDRFRAQANKAKAVQSRVKALEKMEEVQTYEQRRTMRFTFPPCERAGNVVLKCEGLGKRYGDLRVLEDVDQPVLRGQKIAIIGENGAGKTTLLKILAGELAPDDGAVRVGHKVKIGYYAQHHTEQLNTNATIYDEVASIDRGASETRVRTILGTFLFSGDDVDKRIGVLSGGERARVALSKLMAAPGNVLLMDEPTNHLDLESSEALADALREYDGTVLFVSHNRAFVRRLADAIWEVRDREVVPYPGTLDDYLRRGQELESGGSETAAGSAAKGASAASKTKTKPKSEAGPKRDAAAAATPKRSRAEERERKREAARERQERQKKLRPLQAKFEAIEQRIEALETQQRERNLALADPSSYEDAARREELLRSYQAAAAELEEANEEWERLGAEIERAGG